MTTRIEKRLDDLERSTGANDDLPVIVLPWEGPDQIVFVNGEEMTLSEYRKRYPNDKKTFLTWGDGDEVYETD